MSGALLLNSQGTSGIRKKIRRRDGSKRPPDLFKKRSLIEKKEMSKIRNPNK